jgi:high-affinity nickel-transport protein
MAPTVDVLGLTALVFTLGVRHGFDPDHLVAIDGFARSNAPTRPRLARWAGLYFSLGHGMVVTLIGIAVAIYARAWQAPGWLEPVGSLISIGVLAFLGVANLWMAWRAGPGDRVAPIALRGRWVSERLAQASHPAMIAAIGAAFAISFDTVSHAVVFSLTGATAAGWLFALSLGIVFTAGMVLTDALNGWWVARMVARADRKAAAASRWMSLAIGGLCLAIAASGLARLGLPSLDPVMTAYAPFVSVATLVVVASVYLRSALR